MKIISGGQTGVDRAALDEAIERGMEWGGWCPKGGWGEDLTTPRRAFSRSILTCTKRRSRIPCSERSGTCATATRPS